MVDNQANMFHKTVYDLSVFDDCIQKKHFIMWASKTQISNYLFKPNTNVAHSACRLKTMTHKHKYDFLLKSSSAHTTDFLGIININPVLRFFIIKLKIRRPMIKLRITHRQCNESDSMKMHRYDLPQCIACTTNTNTTIHRYTKP